MRRLLLAAALAVALIAPAAAADPPPPSTYGAMYVSAAGTDTNDCSAQAPCSGISRTITRAKAAGVTTVYVEVGQYPPLLRDIRTPAAPVPSAPVKVASWGRGRATVSGITLRGEADLQFEGLRVITSPAASPRVAVSMGQDVFHHYGTQRVRFTNLKVDCDGSGLGVNIRQSDDITLEASEIGGGCSTAIAGPGNTTAANRIRILRNYVGPVTCDSFQFGEWHDVVIDGNTFGRAQRPDGSACHNDNVQLTGDGEHIRITNNWLQGSHGQNMIVQAVVGPLDDLLIANNVIWDADAYAIQITGVSRLRFVNNTVWDHGFGSLLMRGTKGADSIVVNNVLRTMLHDGAASREYLNEGNWIGRFDGVNRDGNPGFVDEPNGELHLLPDSPARGIASSAFTYGPLDRDGLLRDPASPGALR